MVEAAGIELTGAVDNRQVVDFANRQNCEKCHKRRTEVHGGYTSADVSDPSGRCELDATPVAAGKASKFFPSRLTRS